MVLFAMQGFAQNTSYPRRLWKLTDVTGELKLKGQYRKQHTTINDFSEFQKSKYFTGSIILNTKNYIWHPNFMTLDIGGEYSPESNIEDYIVTPDQAEIRTLKGLNIKSTFFSNSLVTISTLFSFNENYSNRENLTNLKSNGKRWGSSLLLKLKNLPITINYEDLKFNQKEIETGFSYKMEQKNLNVNAIKSFGKNDRTEMRYTNSDYIRKEYNNSQLRNQNNNISLQSQIYFDSEKKYLFNSYLYNNNQAGNNNYNIFNVTESLLLKLPHHLQFNSDYNLYNLNIEAQKSNLSKISSTLIHTLFKSLTTNIGYEYSNKNHTFYREVRNSKKFNINYTKKIPTGLLNLSYQFMHLNDQMNSESILLPVLNEQYVLTDGNIVLIERPFIDLRTVVVKDETGTIPYRLDFDYILIKQGEFTEIQRMPGGQIANGASIFVDYVAIQSGSYKYDAISNRINVNISVLKGLINAYSHITIQNYKNVEFTDFLTLNYLEQYFYGSNIDVGFADGGIEFDHYLSTITPYKMTRFFLNLQGNIKERLMLSLNGNIRDYDMLNEDIKRKFSDISGNISYRFSQNSNINLNLIYRKQIGEGVDLDLLTGRSEFKTVYRKLFVTLGLEIYNRNYLNDKIKFNGAYVQFSRKF